MPFNAARVVRCEVAGSSLGKETVLSGKEEVEMFGGSSVSRMHIVAGEVDTLPALQGSDSDLVQCLGTIEEGQAELEARPQPIISSPGVTGGTGVSTTNPYSLDVSIAGEVQVLAATLYQPRLIWFAKSAEEENRYIDRAINACLAGSALAYGVSKFFTVDQDYWHVCAANVAHFT